MTQDGIGLTLWVWVWWTVWGKTVLPKEMGQKQHGPERAQWLSDNLCADTKRLGVINLVEGKEQKSSLSLEYNLLNPRVGRYRL